MNKIFEVKNIDLKRVSAKKLRMKYSIPILHKEGENTTLLGYQSIGITLREELPTTRNSHKIYACFRPFDKYLNKMSGIYGVKKKNLHLQTESVNREFEDNSTTFIIPVRLVLSGDGVKEAIRKWKIKKLIRNSTENAEFIENN